MLKEAEENAEADKALKEKVEAKNQLEAYLYSLRSTMEDSLKDKIDDADKESLGTAVKEALSWLDDHGDGDKETYEEKRKEIETIANPIISKVSSLCFLLFFSLLFHLFALCSTLFCFSPLVN